MNVKNYSEQLEMNWTLEPAEEAMKKLLLLGKEQDGDYPIPRDGGIVSIQQGYDRMLEVDLEPELAKVTSWFEKCLSLDRINKEFVNLAVGLAQGRRLEAEMHKVIFTEIEDIYLDYAQWEVPMGEVPLPDPPQNKISDIHEEYVSLFETEGLTMSWEGEPSDDPWSDAFYLWSLPYCWTGLMMTHAALSIDRDRLLRGNNTFQFTLYSNDECQVLGEVRREGFVSLKKLIEK